MNKAKTITLLSYISIASASAAIITPALPAIASSFDVGKARLGWVVTLFLLGYMIGQLIYGPIANRFGRLHALRAGFTLNIIGIMLSLAAVYMHSFAFLMASRFITALGAAAGMCCTFVLIKEYLNEHEAKQALSLTILSFSLGIGIAVLAGGYITEYFGWQYIFWLLLGHGVLMLLSTGLFQETLQAKQPINLPHLLKCYGKAISNKRLVSYGLMLGVISVFSYCYSTAAPQISHKLLQLNAAHYASWNSLTIVGMIIGGLTCTQLMKRLSPAHIMILSITSVLLGMLSFLLQAITHNHCVIWFFVTATFIYMTSSWLFPAASHQAMESHFDKASASSMMSFVNMASAVILVTIMGYLPLSLFLAMITTVVAFIVITVVVAIVAI